MTTKTNNATRTIECACQHCATYAQREGLTLPLKAEVNALMLGTKPTKATRHNLVRIAHQPPFGKVGAHGPWAIRG